ncbi:MAG: metallophosphoesterase [Verrucomicrobia bacterium]|nr:metallophosphoesterase [Verrucomicrobiota bacterium]
MKRRSFLGTVASAGASGLLAQQPAGAGKPSLVQTPLVLMAPTEHGLEAAWGVSRLSRGFLEWETEAGTAGVAGMDAFGLSPQGDRVLRVRLDGLPSGTRGRIRARTTAADGESVLSDWKRFRTLDSGASSTRFVMWNDTHVNQETLRQLHAVTPAADFLIWNGDTCNDWVQEDLLIPTLLHPGGCDITQGRPLFLTWGNHDVRGAHAFRMSSVVATPGGRPFYAFRSGPVAVICLHTGEDKPDDHPSFQGRVAFDALRAEQTRWLTEVIRRPELRDAPYRLAFCHIPLRWLDESRQDYATGGFDRHSGRSRAAWHDALVSWKAQAILSGHTHQPAWLPPNGDFPYGQIVGGGPQPARATWTEGVADATQLRLKMSRLNGEVVHEVLLKPLS